MIKFLLENINFILISSMLELPLQGVNKKCFQAYTQKAETFQLTLAHIYFFCS